MKKKAKSRPKPYDEMSTTGALSRSSEVTRSLRPIARPERKGATAENPNPVKRSIRPIARPERTIDLTPNAEEGDQEFIGKKPVRAQKKAAVKKKAAGGVVRGMGAATRGGKFTRSS